MRLLRHAGAVIAPALIAAALAGLAANATPGDAPAPAACVAQGVGADSTCAVNGLELHFVDWGGEGPALLLLTGLGDSARIFDEFAPLLAAEHRVIAVTRRGYGRSTAPADEDYSNAALVSDVVGLMDALDIPRASFVGHSIAGGELAALGTRHPDRVERLVYIDAAYDRAQAPRLIANMPPQPLPDPETRGDFERLAEWRQSALGVRSPAVARSLSQVLVQGDDGWTPAAPQSTGAKVLAGDIGAHADWSAIAAPSLALYSSKDVADQVPPNASAAQRRAMIDYSVQQLRPWMLRAQADFIERSQCASALEVPKSTHYLFLERPEWTAQVVLSFLSASDPCHWQAGNPVDGAA